MKKLEKRILAILRAEGRRTVEELAARLKSDTREIENVLKQLHDSGVIVGYQAIVNPEKAGDDTVMSIIEVRVTPQRDMGFDAIARRIYKFPEVKTCYLMSGAYDLLVVLEGQSLRDVAAFVAEKLSTLDHVQSTTTHFLLRKYKEAGVIIHDEEEKERLVISA